MAVRSSEQLWRRDRSGVQPDGWSRGRRLARVRPFLIRERDPPSEPAKLGPWPAHHSHHGGTEATRPSRRRSRRLERSLDLPETPASLGVRPGREPSSGADEFRTANGHSTERSSARSEARACRRIGLRRVRSTIVVPTNSSEPKGWAGLVNSAPAPVAAFGAGKRNPP